MTQRKQKASPKGEPVKPEQVARYLETSITEDHATRVFLPESMVDASTLARWGKDWGLERSARRSWRAAARLHARKGEHDQAERARKQAEKPGRYTEDDLRAWIQSRVSPWPERFRRLAEELREVEKKGLGREVARLDACGHPRGRLVRLFWRSARGEFSRTYGLHRCKSRHCPHCGKRKQNERSEVIQRVLAIAGEWGLGPENVRFLTLTVRNGRDIPTLRAQAHHAWAKLQRRRWWPRHVALWFRGTECITGDDGNWNFHIHVVLVIWSHRISYARIWDEWETAVGERSQVDIDVLHSQKMRETRRKGGIEAAARYVTKYIGKSEEVKNLTQGPGGLAHYASSMGRLRAFAMGGAAPVLRRLAGVLLPSWARRVEGIMEDAHLWGGLPPRRAEEIDTATGEVIACEPLRPALDEKDRATALALAVPLMQQGGTVGEPCGPKGRWRRIGWNPVKGKLRTVAEHVAGKPLDALHQLVAGGRWKIEHCKEEKDGKVRRFRIIVPAERFAWRDVAREVWKRLGEDMSRWAMRRREAFRAWADAKVGALDRRDGKGLLLEALRQADQAARVEAERFSAALDQERRKEVSDPLLVEWLTDMRDYLRSGFIRRSHTRAWAQFDFEMLGI